MSNMSSAEYTVWILNRALRLHVMRSDDAPISLVNNQSQLLQEALDKCCTYLEALAARTCASEIES